MRNKHLFPDTTKVYIFGAVFLILIIYESKSNGKLISSKEYDTVSNRVNEKLNPAIKKHKHTFSKAHPFVLDYDSVELNEIENFEDIPVTPFNTDNDGGVYFSDTEMCPNNTYFCRTCNYPPNCKGRDVNQWVGEAKKNGTYNNYDLRNAWGSKCPSILEISDQGSCDSCWAVVAADVLTDRLCMFTNGLSRERYSAADILTCCKNCSTKSTSNICKQSGFHRRAWMQWIDEGISCGGYKNGSGCLSYPVPPCNHNMTDSSSLNKCRGFYKYNDHCSQKCDTESSFETKPTLLKGKRCYLLKRYSTDPTAKGEDSIKMEIFKRGPVQAVIRANLTSYIPGTIYNSTEEDRGHSVRIVGWGEEKATEGQTQKYWIVANSWGADWGMDGFFYLTFNYIGEDVIYAGQFEESTTC